jgi:hypothetical protein
MARKNNFSSMQNPPDYPFCSCTFPLTHSLLASQVNRLQKEKGLQKIEGLLSQFLFLSSSSVQAHAFAARICASRS